MTYLKQTLLTASDKQYEELQALAEKANAEAKDAKDKARNASSDWDAYKTAQAKADSRPSRRSASARKACTSGSVQASGRRWPAMVAGSGFGR